MPNALPPPLKPLVKIDVTRAEFERMALAEHWNPLTITLLFYPSTPKLGYLSIGRHLAHIVDWPIPAPRS